MNPSSKSKGKDWVDDLVNCGLLGHSPKGRFKTKGKKKVGHWHSGPCDPNMKLTQKNWENFRDCCKRLAGGRRKGRL